MFNVIFVFFLLFAVGFLVTAVITSDRVSSGSRVEAFFLLFVFCVPTSLQFADWWMKQWPGVDATSYPLAVIFGIELSLVTVVVSFISHWWYQKVMMKMKAR